MIYSQVFATLHAYMQFVQLDQNRDGLVKADDIIQFSMYCFIN